MMTHEEIVADPGSLKRGVLERAAPSQPLGALVWGGRVSYIFLERDGVHALSTAVADEMFSCASELPLFAPDEREMAERHDVVFAGTPPSAPAVTGRGLSNVVVGPVHAGVIEPGKFTVVTGGESVVNLGAQFGFSHRGVERHLEGAGACDAAPSVARICGVCSVARSWAYARAIESIVEYTCPDQVEFVRLIAAEMERLYNLVFDLASASAGAGYARGQMDGLRLKERVQRLNERHFGHRYLFDVVVPGSVKEGLPLEPRALQSDLTTFRRDLESYERSLMAVPSVINRFEGAGRVSREIARDFGAVGPAARACGVPIDVREFTRYGAYAWARPKVVIERNGDTEARVRVKFAEANEALRLIDAVLSELRDMPVQTAEPADMRSASGRAICAVEGPRGAETVCVDLVEGVLRRIHAISASYRNWPIVLRAMDGNIVPDFPLVNKSFNLCYACVDR